MMTFTFRNACPSAELARLRLFDETLGLIFLDNMHDYLVTAIPAEISIGCQAGNEICYGGRFVAAGPTASPTPSPTPSTTPATPPAVTPSPTPNVAIAFGVGLNNDRPCSNCCFTCAETTIPRIDLRCALP